MSALQLSSQWGLDFVQGGNPCLLLHDGEKGWFYHARGIGVEAACHSFPEQRCPPLPTPVLARFGGSSIPRETVRVSEDAGLGKETWWITLLA